MPSTLRLDARVIRALRTALPEAAEHCIEVVMAEVPAYSDAWQGSMGQTIASAVRTALDGFITVAARGESEDVMPRSLAIDGAYALGRGEARSGRSADAILSAYRIGARSSWHQLAGVAVEAGVPAKDLADFAELVFAYIDELSAASVAGHTDELATTGRVRQRHLDRLARHLLAGAASDVLAEAAERADWKPPASLTAVLVAPSQARAVLGLADDRTLQAESTLTAAGEEVAVLLVPGAERTRRALLRSLAGRSVVVGPTRPWESVRTSYERALRALAAGLPTEPYDTDAHLADLVLDADPAARGDLRTRVLTPLAGLRPSTRDNLVETLRAWVLHLGRREAVADALFVHPQTVRYRMGQLRELYGEALDDPDFVRDAVTALG